MRTQVASLLLVAHAIAAPSPAGAAQRLVDAVQFASDTLRDVAVATTEHGRPTIYYNPLLLQQIGPELTEFFLAHEYGHLFHGHPGGALAGGDAGIASVRQRQELEADCYAAARLGLANPEAVRAAARFFSRMGPFRFDTLHPSGAQRAANILACLPNALGPAEGMSTVPASSHEWEVGDARLLTAL